MELKGILPALVTPYDAAGEVDFKVFGTLLEHLLGKGVHGFVPMGSTGEYYAMSAEERDDVLRFVKDVVGTRGQLIAGTNAGSTREVIRRTEAAKRIGYDTVLLPPPYYSLPSQDELLAHYHAVLDAVDVEIVLYNFPLRAGLEVGFGVLDALADNPRVIGIKESSGNLLRAIDIAERYGSKYQLSCGSDTRRSTSSCGGARSWICGPAIFHLLDELAGFEVGHRRVDAPHRRLGGLHVAGQRAVLFPHNRTITDPFRLVQRIVEAFRMLGGRVETGEAARFDRAEGRVIAIRLRDGRALPAKLAVVCIGAHTGRLAKLLGESIPLETERGYHTQIVAPGVGLRHSIIWPARAFMISSTAGGIRVGGTVEMAGLGAAPDYRRASALVDRARIALVDGSRKITIGDGLAPGTLLRPLVSEGQYDKVMAAIARARKQGATVAAGGGRPPGLNTGYYVQPTVLVDAPLDSEAWREEIFGPVVCVRSFDDDEQAVRLANDTRFGLAAAVMSADDARAERLAAALRAGIVWINCSQPTFTEAPWGGRKQSGFGRELGRWGFERGCGSCQTHLLEVGCWGWIGRESAPGRSSSM